MNFHDFVFFKCCTICHAEIVFFLFLLKLEVTQILHTKSILFVCLCVFEFSDFSFIFPLESHVIDFFCVCLLLLFTRSSIAINCKKLFIYIYMTLYAHAHKCLHATVSLWKGAQNHTISDTDWLQSMIVDHHKHLRQVNDLSMH